MDMISLLDQASGWTATKVVGAQDHLDAATPCDEWDVRTLMNHMLDTQQYFVGAAKGEDISPPGPNPPELLGSDPARDFSRGTATTHETFAQPGVIDKTGPSLGIAFSDMLLHGWDLAMATDQDATMPKGLADAAYNMVHGKFTDEQRKGVFKPAVKVGADVSAQDRLLAYTGRDPGR